MADDNTKESKLLNKILEFGGAIIILGIVFLFIVLTTAKSCNRDDNKIYVDTLHIAKIDFFEISKKKSDTNFIIADKNMVNNLKITTDSINNKIVQLNKASKEINEIQKENSDILRFYLTILGSIFAIVGFFGFKSIHDTRQTAIDSVKIKAEEVAIKAIEDKMSGISKGHVENFLNNEGKKNIESIAKKIASEKGIEVAKNEMAMIKIDNGEYRKGIIEDIEITQKLQNNNFNFLLKRIQELELKLYGKPDNDDLPDFDKNPKMDPDNEQPVV